MGVTSLGSLGLKDVSSTKTASFTVDGTAWMYPCDATAGAVVVSLPSAASAKGRILSIKKIDASGNAVTVDPNAAETVDSQATLSTTTQYASFLLWCDGVQWWKLN